MIHLDMFQDFLNMYFKDIYQPIPPVYNLVLAMLWRHPENVDLDRVKVVHYCAAVRYCFTKIVYISNIAITLIFLIHSNLPYSGIY